MTPVNPAPTSTATDLAVIQNRIAVALAKRERLIKSWTASSNRQRAPPKTQEELDEEDADLFRIEPPNLGLGAPIPKEFLEGDIKRRDISSNDKLKNMIMGKRVGLAASKPRDANEKAGSAKRSLKEESSDEEEGRSGLGKAKKSKLITHSTLKPHHVEGEARVAHKQNGLLGESHVSRPEIKSQSRRVIKPSKLLVDYSSDEDELDNDGKLPPITTIQKKVHVTLSTSDIPEDKMNPPLRPMSRPASSHSSKTSKASSDSEQSDMETAIPIGLTADVVASTSISLTKLSLSEEAKKAKRRLKRARRKEREQQQKAAALTPTAGRAEKHTIESTAVQPMPKKLKDRLLDANGN